MTARAKCHQWVKADGGGEACSLCPATCRRDRLGRVVVFDANLPPPLEAPRFARKGKPARAVSR